MIEPQPLFEEYCQRVVKQGDMFICTLEKKFLIPLMDRVKQQYVLHCIDRIHDTSDVIEYVNQTNKKKKKKFNFWKLLEND